MTLVSGEKMNSIQVPDPGLIYKLEHLLSGDGENVYLDVRIVCRDGEFLWSRLLLSSMSRFLHTLISATDSPDADHTIIMPDVNKETMRSLLHNVIASSQAVIEDVSLVELLAVDNSYLQQWTIEENIKVSGISPLPDSIIVKDEEDHSETLFYSCKEETESTKKKTQRKMMCKFCSLDFRSQSYSDYQEHILTHKNSGGLYECPINACTKTYKSWSHLCEHYFSHNNSPKPHLCSYCSYTSITRANVRKHELAVHEDPERRPFECPTCSKRFKTASNLNDHIKVHTTEKFECKTCNKTFKSQIGLQQHERLHTGDLFPCSVCGEKFQSKHSVNRHQRDIHGVYSSSDPDKVSKCTKKGCEAEFSSEEDFRVHVRTAHGARAAVLICHLCTKICPTRGSLKQHFRKMHGTAAAAALAGNKMTPAPGKSSSGHSRGNNKSLLKQEKSIPKEDETVSPSPAASSAVTAATAGVSVNNYSSLQNYSCDICLKNFTTCYARDKHVSTHEHGQHTCPHCHVDQPSRIVLNMHMKYCKSRPESTTNDIVIYVNDP